MAPEQLLCLPYSFNVDVWALGVIASILQTVKYKKMLIQHDNGRWKQLENIQKICGDLPGILKATALTTGNKRIVRECLEPMSIAAGHSVDMVDLIDRMLTMDPMKRPSASDVLKDAYFKEQSKLNSLYKDSFEADYVIVEDGRGGRAWPSSCGISCGL